MGFLGCGVVIDYETFVVMPSFELTASITKFCSFVAYETHKATNIGSENARGDMNPGGSVQVWIGCIKSMRLPST